jgi:hypothetical protein
MSSPTKTREPKQDLPAVPAAVQGIDRYAVVRRHDVHLGAADARNPLTVGNGDFAYTADITGMQTFHAFHDPRTAEAEGRLAVNAATMSTWGWHEMPNPEGYVLQDAMTTYETSRGPVEYPDRFDIKTLFGGDVADEFRAGTWLHVNPQRIDLGRIGLLLRRQPGAEPETDPSVLTDVHQRLDLWEGTITSKFRYEGEPVEVTTAAHPESSTVAFRVSSALLTDGRLSVGVKFPYATTSFYETSDWVAEDRHQTTVEQAGNEARVHRVLDATEYDVHLTWNAGALSSDPARHELELVAASNTLELVAGFAPAGAATAPRAGSAAGIFTAARLSWGDFWSRGAVLDLSGSTDPRSGELERRIVLSQYLTAVNCAGSQPPQETGLVTNSWQGKFHLEMHWWHAAHFASWGRPEMLERSLGWYEQILDAARDTARRQHYAGARWPKQVGPDGRESPTDIGSLLIWQQPHPIFYAELLRRADPTGEAVSRYATIVEETARFMASFVEERADGFHLPAPIMPAQEFYDARTTEDPTFELAYWAYALQVAQDWRTHSGQEPLEEWERIIAGLATPHSENGQYSAIATPPYTRRDDHPAMVLALGFVPQTSVIDVDTMRATLAGVREDWDWQSTWGWDYPAMAMAATRVGDPDLAIDCLLMDAPKNTYLANGHNPQMGNMLPIYLPGNGGLLAAVSLMTAGWDTSGQTPGFPTAGWTVRHEGFVPWP